MGVGVNAKKGEGLSSISDIFDIFNIDINVQ